MYFISFISERNQSPVYDLFVYKTEDLIKNL